MFHPFWSGTIPIYVCCPAIIQLCVSSLVPVSKIDRKVKYMAMATILVRSPSQNIFPWEQNPPSPTLQFFTVIIVANYTRQIISSCQSSHVWLLGINHCFQLSNQVLESMILLFLLKETPLKRASIHHSSCSRTNWLKLPDLQTCLWACGFRPAVSRRSSSCPRAFRMQLRALFYQDGTVICGENAVLGVWPPL